MYESIQGSVKELTPTYAIIETGGIGYFVHISLHCYSQIQNNAKVELFLHLAVREDAHILYGFFNKDEREVFRKLISVSGVGANTARMILSSMTPAEVQRSIVESNVELLKSIKGIGAKSAQRIIVDLKDKMDIVAEVGELLPSTDNTIKHEALSALDTLGFNKKQAEKVINKIIMNEPELQVEQLIKKALKLL